MRRAVVSLVLVLSFWAPFPVELVHAQSPTPDPAAEADRGGDDLDLDRLSRPREPDSSPGRAAGLPLAVAAVAHRRSVWLASAETGASTMPRDSIFCDQAAMRSSVTG